jgi:hypothetical protein
MDLEKKVAATIPRLPSSVSMVEKWPAHHLEDFGSNLHH